jgi:excisionase family DNA binding protein
MSQELSQESDLLTFKEAMVYLRVSRSTIYRLLWNGQLKGAKVSMTWRFRKSDLDKCIVLQSVQPLHLQATTF